MAESNKQTVVKLLLLLSYTRTMKCHCFKQAQKKQGVSLSYPTITEPEVIVELSTGILLEGTLIIISLQPWLLKGFHVSAASAIGNTG